MVGLVGCGGGGGGGSSSDVGVDPIEVEIRAQLQGFAASVAARDGAGAMRTWADSQFVCLRATGAPPENYSSFEARLTQFLNGVASVSLTFPDLGVIGNDLGATARGHWQIVYQTPGGQPQTLLEEIQISLEREVKWGIVSISGPNLAYSVNFPPALP